MMDFLSGKFSKLNSFFWGHPQSLELLEPRGHRRELGNKLFLQGIYAQNPTGFGGFFFEEPRFYFVLFLTSSFLRNKGSGLGLPDFPEVFPKKQKPGKFWDFRSFKCLNLAPDLEVSALFPLHSISLSRIHRFHPSSYSQDFSLSQLQITLPGWDFGGGFA